MPGYRIGHWSWLRFPSGFDVRTSEDPLSLGLLWIDTDAQAEDLAAFRTGRRHGPPRTQIHERWRGD